MKFEEIPTGSFYIFNQHTTPSSLMLKTANEHEWYIGSIRSNKLQIQKSKVWDDDYKIYPIEDALKFLNGLVTHNSQTEDFKELPVGATFTLRYLSGDVYLKLDSTHFIQLFSCGGMEIGHVDENCVGHIRQLDYQESLAMVGGVKSKTITKTEPPCQGFYCYEELRKYKVPVGYKLVKITEEQPVKPIRENSIVGKIRRILRFPV